MERWHSGRVARAPVCSGSATRNGAENRSVIALPPCHGGAGLTRTPERTSVCRCNVACCFPCDHDYDEAGTVAGMGRGGRNKALQMVQVALAFYHLPPDGRN